MRQTKSILTNYLTKENHRSKTVGYLIQVMHVYLVALYHRMNLCPFRKIFVPVFLNGWHF